MIIFLNVPQNYLAFFLKIPSPNQNKQKQCITQEKDLTHFYKASTVKKLYSEAQNLDNVSNSPQSFKHPNIPKTSTRSSSLMLLLQFASPSHLPLVLAHSAFIGSLTPQTAFSTSAACYACAMLSQRSFNGCHCPATQVQGRTTNPCTLLYLGTLLSQLVYDLSVYLKILPLLMRPATCSFVELAEPSLFPHPKKF